VTEYSDHATWLTATAWQGGGLVVNRLKEIRPGVYQSTVPLPLYGTWKTLIRLQNGNALNGLPIYAPADDAIPVPGVAAPRSFERPFVSDHQLLQREAKVREPAVAYGAYAVIVFFTVLLLAMLARGRCSRRRRPSERSAVMPETLERVPDDPTTDDGDGAEPTSVRIAIVGAGFSGIGMAIRLREAGIDDFVVLERAEDVGGTWQANTYPGCQCDVPSHLYSFSFQPNPGWTRTYSLQPEIWAYLRRCSETHGIGPHLRFGHELTGATWDEGAHRWRVETSRGAFSADLLIDASGPLSHPAVPSIRGLRRFEGKLFHSAQWDHDHDLTGERVAVIGTGASAVQFVPKIAERVGQMHVFQRTAPWIMPHSDRPTTRLERQLYRRLPSIQRLVRSAVYWSRESFVIGFAKHPSMARPAERIAKLHLRHLVRDRELRRRLEPDFRLGCKRVLISNEWYPALTRPNVELVTETARGARSTRSSSPPASTSPTRRPRGSCAGAAASRSRRPPATARGHTSARRWPASPTSSRSSGRTPASDTARWST